MSRGASSRLDRRSFLKRSLAGVGGFVGVVGLTGCAHGEATLTAELAQPQLLASMGPETVHALGATYMRDRPAERTRHALMSGITSRLLPWPAGTASSVAGAVARDFAEGRTVSVNGWMLAVTEARQCALYALATA